MIPIILSGGSGSRLWPLSRKTYPKQFLQLVSEYSLFQETCMRLSLGEMEKPIVVCNNDHRFLAAHQLKDINVDVETIILEPIGRNTAPAIAIAALHLEAQGRDEIMLVLPADHVITDTVAFKKVLQLGNEAALNSRIVTFGIVPDAPLTGFGYIQAANKSKDGAEILAFKEKPDVLTAKKYVESGDYYWNSGMFMFSSSVYLAELARSAPDILKSCIKAYNDISEDFDFLRLNEKSFEDCRSESIDYAIMEKIDNAFVIPLDAGWSDLGAWSSILDVKKRCVEGNAIDGDVIQHDCKGSYFYSENKLVTAIGLEDMVVIDTPDALLVAPKARVQEVTSMVDNLNMLGRPEAIINRLVHRPWGTFNSLDKSEQHQVKRIKVYPGQKLSVQMHNKRSEHWVVVNGTATVTLNEDVFELKEYESVYIPVKSVHALENKTDRSLELIEVQCGSYLGEDDIVRFEDVYGRQGTNS